MPAQRLRVLTLNTLWQPAARRRLRAIAPILNQSDIDVICLQEVVLRANARLLARCMGNYQPPALRPFGIWCLGGLATFSRVPALHSSYEAFDQRGEWFSIGAADRLLRKGFLTTRYRFGRLDVIIVNTHLLANYDQDWSSTNRYARHEASELEQLSRALRAADQSALVVAAGDFNVPPHIEMFQRFTLSAELANVFGESPSPPTIRLSNVEPAPLIIDHIMYRAPEGSQVEVSAETKFDAPLELGRGLTGFASDHIGVLADFRVGRAGASAIEML